MAEITQATIEANLAAIDAAIATLVGAFPGGINAAQYVDYKVGALDVKGSQQLENLIKAREVYQVLYEKIPNTTADVVSYDIDVRGIDNSELLGDE